MTNPKDPLRGVPEGAPVCVATLTAAERNRASLARLQASQRLHAEKVKEQQKAAARLKTAARNRKYREARKAST